MGEATIGLEKIVVIDPKRKGGLGLINRLYMDFGTYILKMGPQAEEASHHNSSTTFYPTSQQDAGKYCIVVNFEGTDPSARFIRYAPGCSPVSTEMSGLKIMIDDDARNAINKNLVRHTAYVSVVPSQSIKPTETRD